jgi:threonine dehydrogenase-like Zn-dependent dehydrogenase
MNKIVVNEIELIGSRCGSMRTALNWLTEDKVTFPDLTRVEYSLTDFIQAFKDAEDKAIEKVYLAP